MRYRVLTLFSPGVGTVLALSEAQARDRRHALKPLDDGRYEVTAPVQFKIGEVVGYDGEPSKALPRQLERLDPPAEKSAPVASKTKRSG